MYVWTSSFVFSVHPRVCPAGQAIRKSFEQTALVTCFCICFWKKIFHLYSATSITTSFKIIVLESVAVLPAGRVVWRLGLQILGTANVESTFFLLLLFKILLESNYWFRRLSVTDRQTKWKFGRLLIYDMGYVLFQKDILFPRDLTKTSIIEQNTVCS